MTYDDLKARIRAAVKWPWSQGLRLGMLGALLLLPRLGLPACGADGVWLQVLGSGGPELDDGRSSSAYLVWHEGRARVLVDLGSGSTKPITRR